MKVYIGFMVLVFAILLVSILGMKIDGAHWWKELHELTGAIFILLIFGHLWMNRFILKTLFSPKNKS